MFSWLNRYLNKWVVIGGMVVTILMIGFWGGVLWFFSPVKGPISGSKVEMTVIVAKTYTSVPPTRTPSPTPNTSLTQVILPVDIEVGAYVKVSGTGADGLRVREGPSISERIDFLAPEGAVLRVDGGPQEADGYRWWYLVLTDNPEKRGWAVDDFLLLTDQP